jgi:hypothetical protein
MMPPMRVAWSRSPTAIAVAMVLALALSACLPGTEANPMRLQAQARAALERWAAAVAAGGGPTGFVPVGELTGQIGDWEEAVGDNKAALFAGMVIAATALPEDPPAGGEIQWPDGTVQPVAVVSAVQALEAIRSGSDGSCPDCSPLQVTSARLTTGPLETSRGRATVPMWAFTIAGTAVEVTRVAVAQGVVVQPPPWDANNPPLGIGIRAATGTVAGRSLTVSFTGAPGPASEGCGADYTAEAVESELAVVVIVHEHRNGQLGACAAVGAERFATVELARPLGDRAVLEVQQGLPVAVTLTP